MATESAIASLHYVFETLGISDVYAMADCDNRASNKILVKLGFEFVELFEYDGVLHAWYKIHRN